MTLFSRNAGSVDVSPETALSLPYYYRCVDLISDSMATPDCELINIDGKIKSKAISHPCWDLLYNYPNDRDTPFEFRKLMFVHVLTWGNAYAYINRDGKNRPTSLDIYHPTEVGVYSSNHGRKVWYSFPDKSGQIPADDVFHLKLFNTDGVIGRTPIYMAYNAMRMALQGQRLPADLFENGAMLSGLITHPGKPSEPALKNIKDSWFTNYHGLKNAGRVPVLAEGMDYKQVGINPVDAQLIELMQFSNEQIVALLGVPQHMAGILTRSTNNNIEQQGLEYRNSLNPRERAFCDQANRKLLYRGEMSRYYYRINLNDLALADLLSRKEWFQSTLAAGVYSPNEVRDMLDENPYDGGDSHRVQGAMIDVNKQNELIDSQILANKSKSQARENSKPAAQRNGQTLTNLNGHAAHVN